MDKKGLEGRRILVVEDEYYLADELASELVDIGAIVLGPVGTVQDALAMTGNEGSIDGAVIDINLRGEKAFPVADRLTERGVPFVFVTGYDRSAIPACYEHIARCEKPVDVRKVIAAIGHTAHAA